MKDLAVNLLLVVIGVMLIVTTALVVELGKARDKPPVIEIVTVEIPSAFVFYTGVELNEEVQRIAEGGGTQSILDFFDFYTDDRQVSSIIFEQSLNQKVPITAAFALAWGESRYRTDVINRNGGNTSDWGLYQINDGYRNWTREDFLDPVKNAEEGLSYFSYSLDTFNGNLPLAIAGYNKGVENIKGGSGIPHTTLAHINNIIEYDRMLEIKLNEFIQGLNNER